MKRLLALTIGALLLCPITSLAAPSEEARAVYEEMNARYETLNEINMYYDMNMTMTGDLVSELGMDALPIQMAMNIRMQNMQDPAALRYQAFTRMDMGSFGGQMDMVTYYENGYSYMDMMGSKYKTPVPVDQILSETESMAQLAMLDANSIDMFSDMSLTYDGDNRILTYSMDDGKMNELMAAAMGLSSISDLYGDNMQITLSNVHGSYVINPEGYYTNALVSMDMSMNILGDTVNYHIEAGIGVENPGQPVVINPPNPAEYSDL